MHVDQENIFSNFLLINNNINLTSNELQNLENVTANSNRSSRVSVGVNDSVVL